MKVFNHQAAAFSELLIRASIFFRGHWRRLGLRSRWHTLIVGETGTGKTALVTMLAEKMDTSLLRISVPSWMPCGSNNRAVIETVSVIADHVAKHDKTILFADELDKLQDSPWASYCKGELFDILDGKWPNGLRVSDQSDEYVPTIPDLLTEKLVSSVFVIAGGTFQNYFDEKTSKSVIGFQGEAPDRKTGISAIDIIKYLPRELTNRFNSDIVCLPELQSEHYWALAEQATKSLPPWLQAQFAEAVRSKINEAISTKKGCRFLEESLMVALKATHKLEIGDNKAISGCEQG